MQIKIKCYYHVTMINEFDEITDYIFGKIMSSGLYDEIESISIGALGSADELPKLQKVLDKYPKAKIRVHNEDKGIFEFLTMRLLKDDADNSTEKFYAIYIHSKSVTFSKHGDLNNWKYEIFWRDYLTWATIDRWKDNYRALDLPEWGYDTAGARVIPSRMSASHRYHYSGNFWWANSEYVKKWKPIDEFDTGDRFEAEMMICSAMPIMYISCNCFCEGFPYWYGTFDEWMNKNDISKYCTRP